MARHIKTNQDLLERNDNKHEGQILLGPGFQNKNYGELVCWEHSRKKEQKSKDCKVIADLDNR
jgi:hypothetical protein